MLTVLLALVAITPILYLPGVGGFEAMKSAFFLICGSILLCFWSYNLICKRPYQARKSVLVPGIFLIGYIIIRTLFVAAPNIAWLGSEVSNWGAPHWILWIILLTVISTRSFSERDKQLLLVTVGISLIGIVLLVAAQKMGLEHITWLLYDDPSRGRSLIGSIGSSGQLGLILAVLTICILPLASAAMVRTRAGTAIYWLLITLAAVLVFATKSQSGIVLLGIGTILHIPALRTRLRQNHWIGLTACILLLPLVLAVLPTPAAVSNRAPSFSARIDTWKTALRGSIHTPLFGVGIEQFPFLYDRYTTTVPANASVVSEEHPHAIIIELLAEWGVVGVGLFIWFACSLFRHTVHDTIHLPAAVVWLLAMQTNVGTVTMFVLGIVIAILLTKSTPNETTQIAPYVGWIALPVSMASLALAVIIGIGGILYAHANDTGVRQSAEYLFRFAADSYQQTFSWPFSRSYAHLEYAEALTNNALKYKTFTNGAEVVQHVQLVVQGSPTARNLVIATQILAVWNKQAPTAEIRSLYTELSRRILDTWGTTPRFQALRSRS